MRKEGGGSIRRWYWFTSVDGGGGVRPHSDYYKGVFNIERTEEGRECDTLIDIERVRKKSIRFSSFIIVPPYDPLLAVSEHHRLFHRCSVFITCCRMREKG
ncbi:hypothetical protein L1987_24638 [Smallanthus sonchifolius]|uniref:Uncharacterized protein n=1 Tax=Smallanthus sonchifolius TaxID=185202 RepID=A0ACB9IL07_9ASTR|nr:hypothetical protein L1987_24638 [Smallanthus sonchifolius]